MNRYRFKFKGAGVHVDPSGKSIGPGEEFECNFDIREKFAEKDGRFELLKEKQPSKSKQSFRSTKTSNQSEKEKTPVTTLEKVPRGPGWFDVKKKDTEEAINDRALREHEADELIEQFDGASA